MADRLRELARRFVAGQFSDNGFGRLTDEEIEAALTEIPGIGPWTVRGFLIIFLVFRENSHASAIVEVGTDQHVVDTGPYRIVRHPMYAGALIMFVGIPPALGSWWGLLPAAGIVPVLAWRLTREEAFLAANLAGYGDYRARVRYRLAPILW